MLIATNTSLYLLHLRVSDLERDFPKFANLQQEIILDVRMLGEFDATVDGE